METPKFNSDEEFFAWTFEKISEAITNLTHRVAQVEEGLQKIPPPGADMIKYKPPMSPVYQNLKELFDTIFGTLNSYEERMARMELDEALPKKDRMDENIKVLLIPKDPAGTVLPYF